MDPYNQKTNYLQKC